MELHLNKVIFLHSKLPTDSTALHALGNRWNLYGQLVQNQGQEDGITLFTFRPLTPQVASVLSSKTVRQISALESKSSLLFRVSGLCRKILVTPEKHTLVCGDNGISLVIAVLLKILLHSRVGVQVQFHGDIYTFDKKKGLLGFVRVCLSRIGITFADSIRIVSEFQKREIGKISKSAENKFVLAPIPINWNCIATERSKIEFDIAFIGRFHSERGIKEMLEILKLAKESKPEIRILIAGEGPLENEIKIQMSRWIQDSTCSMPGFLNASQIRNIYATSQILLSTAPHEGYGLTIREAALSGMRVVARISGGVNEAILSFPNSIHGYTGVDNAVQLLLEQIHLSSILDTTNYINNQKIADKEGLSRLTRSWLKL